MYSLQYNIKMNPAIFKQHKRHLPRKYAPKSSKISHQGLKELKGWQYKYKNVDNSTCMYCSSDYSSYTAFGQVSQNLYRRSDHSQLLSWLINCSTIVYTLPSQKSTTVHDCPKSDAGYVMGGHKIFPRLDHPVSVNFLHFKMYNYVFFVFHKMNRNCK